MSEYAPVKRQANPVLDPVFYFRVSGWALAAVSVLGIISWTLDTRGEQVLSFDYTFLQFTMVHNFVHIVLAAACFLFGYAALQPKLVKVFAIVFGGVYLVLGVVGFFAFTAPQDDLLSLTPTLNVLHILLGGWALTAGLLSR